MLKYPEPFLEVRVTSLGDEFDTLALCAGYEGKQWRAAQLAKHLIQWLPFAALDQEAQNSFSISNWFEMVARAAAHVYKTKKTASRGEIGELILHIACVNEFETIPVLCKLILKTSSNDTVKGFDGVHARIVDDQKLELWLGESKFYKDPKRAIKEAVASVRDHILPDFLDTEKAMIFGHIAPGVPKRDEIIRLFKANTSSDELLKYSVFPILIAYDSASSASYKEVCEELIAELTTEVAGLRDVFKGEIADVNLRFQLIFLPMAEKSSLIDEFDRRLEALR